MSPLPSPHTQLRGAFRTLYEKATARPDCQAWRVGAERPGTLPSPAHGQACLARYLLRIQGDVEMGEASDDSDADESGRKRPRDEDGEVGEPPRQVRRLAELLNTASLDDDDDDDAMDVDEETAVAVRMLDSLNDDALYEIYMQTSSLPDVLALARASRGTMRVFRAHRSRIVETFVPQPELLFLLLSPHYEVDASVRAVLRRRFRRIVEDYLTVVEALARDIRQYERATMNRRGGRPMSFRDLHTAIHTFVRNPRDENGTNLLRYRRLVLQAVAGAPWDLLTDLPRVSPSLYGESVRATLAETRTMPVPPDLTHRTQAAELVAFLLEMLRARYDDAPTGRFEEHIVWSLLLEDLDVELQLTALLMGVAPGQRPRPWGPDDPAKIYVRLPELFTPHSSPLGDLHPTYTLLPDLNLLDRNRFQPHTYEFYLDRDHLVPHLVPGRVRVGYRLSSPLEIEYERAKGQFDTAPWHESDLDRFAYLVLLSPNREPVLRRAYGLASGLCAVLTHSEAIHRHLDEELRNPELFVKHAYAYSLWAGLAGHNPAAVAAVLNQLPQMPYERNPRPPISTVRQMLEAFDAPPFAVEKPRAPDSEEQIWIIPGADQSVSTRRGSLAYLATRTPSEYAAGYAGSPVSGGRIAWASWTMLLRALVRALTPDDPFPLVLPPHWHGWGYLNVLALAALGSSASSKDASAFLRTYTDYAQLVRGLTADQDRGARREILRPLAIDPIPDRESFPAATFQVFGRSLLRDEGFVDAYESSPRAAPLWTPSRLWTPMETLAFVGPHAARPFPVNLSPCERLETVLSVLLQRVETSTPTVLEHLLPRITTVAVQRSRYPPPAVMGRRRSDTSLRPLEQYRSERLTPLIETDWEVRPLVPALLGRSLLEWVTYPYDGRGSLLDGEHVLQVGPVRENRNQRRMLADEFQDRMELPLPPYQPVRDVGRTRALVWEAMRRLTPEDDPDRRFLAQVVRAVFPSSRPSLESLVDRADLHVGNLAWRLARLLMVVTPRQLEELLFTGSRDVPALRDEERQVLHAYVRYVVLDVSEAAYTYVTEAAGLDAARAGRLLFMTDAQAEAAMNDPTQEISVFMDPLRDVAALLALEAAVNGRGSVLLGSTAVPGHHPLRQHAPRATQRALGLAPPAKASTLFTEHWNFSAGGGPDRESYMAFTVHRYAAQRLPLHAVWWQLVLGPSQTAVPADLTALAADPDENKARLAFLIEAVPDLLTSVRRAAVQTTHDVDEERSVVLPSSVAPWPGSEEAADRTLALVRQIVQTSVATAQASRIGAVALNRERNREVLRRLQTEVVKPLAAAEATAVLGRPSGLVVRTPPAHVAYTVRGTNVRIRSTPLGGLAGSVLVVAPHVTTRVRLVEALVQTLLQEVVPVLLARDAGRQNTWGAVNLLWRPSPFLVVEPIERRRQNREERRYNVAGALVQWPVYQQLANLDLPAPVRSYLEQLRLRTSAKVQTAVAGLLAQAVANRSWAPATPLERFSERVHAEALATQAVRLETLLILDAHGGHALQVLGGEASRALGASPSAQALLRQRLAYITGNLKYENLFDPDRYRAASNDYEEVKPSARVAPVVRLDDVAFVLVIVRAGARHYRETGTFWKVGSQKRHFVSMLAERVVTPRGKFQKASMSVRFLQLFMAVCYVLRREFADAPDVLTDPDHFLALPRHPDYTDGRPTYSLTGFANLDAELFVETDSNVPALYHAYFNPEKPLLSLKLTWARMPGTYDVVPLRALLNPDPSDAPDFAAAGEPVRRTTHMPGILPMYEKLIAHENGVRERVLSLPPLATTTAEIRPTPPKPAYNWKHLYSSPLREGESLTSRMLEEWDSFALSQSSPTT